MEDLTLWADHLESAIEAEGLILFDRVFVLGATGSTQDAARRLCGPRPGAVVVAGRQLAGRGRHGKSWEQHAGLGVAVTFVLPADILPASVLSLAAGLAAAEAVEHMVGRPEVRIGLRWPNDVMECGQGRKVAGVLIEVVSPLLLIGVGINVLQAPSDWQPQLAGRACSIQELGGNPDRLETVRSVMIHLERAMGLDSQTLRDRWLERDTLCGQHAELVHNGRTYAGTVESISPAHEIIIRHANGEVAHLPAAATMVSASGPRPA
jgi:BirA family transcriptional regulator, biotin operon repressor / biotin---[acetyl-CoA-carboxylase] ligase